MSAEVINRCRTAVEACIAAWDWPTPGQVHLIDVSTAEMMETPILLVKLRVTDAPPEDSIERAELDSMLEALTDHLDCGDDMHATARMTAYQP